MKSAVFISAAGIFSFRNSFPERMMAGSGSAFRLTGMEKVDFFAENATISNNPFLYFLLYIIY